MPQYTIGQILTLNLKLKVLRAFAIEDTIYYIVGVLTKDSVLRHTATPIYGVFRNDGTYDAISQEALLRAAQLVKSEKLLENLE